MNVFEDFTLTKEPPSTEGNVFADFNVPEPVPPDPAEDEQRIKDIVDISYETGLSVPDIEPNFRQLTNKPKDIKIKTNLLHTVFDYPNLDKDFVEETLPFITKVPENIQREHEEQRFREIGGKLPAGLFGPTIGAAPPKGLWQRAKNYIQGEDIILQLPPNADRMEILTTMFDQYMQAPWIILKYFRGRAGIDPVELAWATLKRVTPDDMWDGEVKNMTFDEAFDWYGTYHPSGLIKAMGDLAQFSGRIKTMSQLTGLENIVRPKDLPAIIKAGELANLFGLSAVPDQISKLASERIDPTETDYGYEGGIAVLRDWTIGAIFSLTHSGVKGAWSKLTPSEEQRALKLLRLKKGASIDEIRNAARGLARKYHPDKAEGLRYEFEKVIKARDILVKNRSQDIIFRGQKINFQPKVLPGETIKQYFARTAPTEKPTEVPAKQGVIAKKPEVKVPAKARTIAVPPPEAIRPQEAKPMPMRPSGPEQSFAIYKRMMPNATEREIVKYMIADDQPVPKRLLEKYKDLSGAEDRLEQIRMDKLIAKRAEELKVVEEEKPFVGKPKSFEDMTLGEFRKIMEASNLAAGQKPAVPAKTAPIKKPYEGLKPGTPEWMNVWKANPELQDEMLTYEKQVKPAEAVPEKVQAPAPQAEREPWEMTREEYKEKLAKTGIRPQSEQSRIGITDATSRESELIPVTDPDRIYTKEQQKSKIKFSHIPDDALLKRTPDNYKIPKIKDLTIEEKNIGGQKKAIKKGYIPTTFQIEDIEVQVPNKKGTGTHTELIRQNVDVKTVYEVLAEKLSKKLGNPQKSNLSEALYFYTQNGRSIRLAKHNPAYWYSDNGIAITIGDYEGDIVIPTKPHLWMSEKKLDEIVDKSIQANEKLKPISEMHNVFVKRAIEQNKPVPREVLEEYKSEPWAKEALAKPPGEGKPMKMPEIASGLMPQEPPGLTKAEVEFLGRRQQSALREAQKLGYPVGYKKGYQWAALEGRRRLDALRVDVKIGEKSREDVKDVIKMFVPKEEQGRYLTGLARTKTPKDVERITNQIEKFIDGYEHRRAVREFKKFVNGIRKKYNRGEVKLGKLTGPAKDKLEKVLKEYDLAKLSEEKAEELQKHKEHIQKIAGSVARAFREWETVDEQGIDIFQLPNRRIQDLERLEKTPLKDLDTEQIQYIQDELQSLVTNEERKNQIRNNIKSEYAHTYITEASNEVYERGKTKKGEIKVPNVIKRGLDIEQANLRTLIRGITTKDAKATEEFLVDRLWDAGRKKDGLVKKWETSAKEEFQKLNLGDEFLDGLDKEVEITWGGEKVTVPGWVVFNTYMDAEAEGNLKRLLTAKTHTFTSLRGKPVKLGKLGLEELQNMMDKVPQSWRKAADLIFKLNRTNNAPAINETSMWERGYPIAVFEKYHSFPRRIMGLPAGHRTEIALIAENRGRYQKRTGGTEEHIITNPMVQFLNNMQQDADYAAMALVRQDAKALLADRKWRKRMDAAGNSTAVGAIIKLYQRAEGLVSDQSIADYMAGKYLSTFGKGVLSLRPSGTFVQMASVPAAYPVIEQRYFTTGFVTTPKLINMLEDKYPSLWIRWGHRNYDFVLGVSSARDRIREIITGKSRLRDVMIKNYTWGDQFAVGRIYEGAWNKARQTTDYNPGKTIYDKGSPEFEAELEKIFFRGMESQPQWDTGHRSLTTSETGMIKRGFSLFMSARIQQWNVALQAIDDMNKGRVDKRTGYSHLGDVAEANLRVGLYRNLFRLFISTGVGAGAVLLGVRDEEQVKENLKKEMETKAKRIVPEWITTMMGLPVYGAIVANIADEITRGLTAKRPRSEYGDVRTGNIFADFLVDLGLEGWSVADFSRDLWKWVLDDDDAYYKSGPKEGDPKWKDSGMEVINNAGEIISQLTGFGWSGPRSDIIWPAEQVLKEEE